MNPVNKRIVVSSQPQAILNNNSVTTNVIDTQGYGFLEVYVLLGATDIALTALRLEESDAITNATTLNGGAAVVGTRFGTDARDDGAASVLPSATDDNQVYKFELNLQGRRRYIKPIITIGNGATGAFTVCFAELSEPDNHPGTAAEKGVAQLMRLPVIS
jgi:hypothetical protein